MTGPPADKGKGPLRHRARALEHAHLLLSNALKIVTMWGCTARCISAVRHACQLSEEQVAEAREARDKSKGEILEKEQK